MSFVEAVQTGFRKYAVFSGRATRSEFWWWQLFTWMLGITLRLVDSLLGVAFMDRLGTLAVLVPSIAVLVRRLHDTGRSAWWLLGFAVVALIWTVGLAILAVGLMDAAQTPEIRTQGDGAIRAVFFTGLGTGIAAVVGSLALIGYYVYVLTRPSQLGTNAYGPQPGAAAVEA